MVSKKITLVGRSIESFDVAVDDAISRVGKTLAGVHWVEVKKLGVELVPVETREYQTEVEIALEPEGEDGE